MNKPALQSNRKNRRIVSLAIWTGFWLLSVVLAATIDGTMARATAVALLGLNIVAGVALILACIRHLNTLDELMQKIQLEAMAVALGATVIGGLSYTLLQQSHLIQFETRISHLIMAITVVYLLAIAYGYRRHQ